MVKPYVRSTWRTGSNTSLTIVQGDALQESDVVGAAKGVASIFHCVNLPYPAWHDPHDGIVPMLRHTVTAAEQHSARIVFPGNVYVFGHVKAELVTEDQPFAAHTRKGRLRAQMEDMLATAWHRDGVPFVTVRMPDFYGPAVDNALYRPLFENALTGRPLAWYGDLDAPLELVLIGDAATAITGPRRLRTQTNLPQWMARPRYGRSTIRALGSAEEAISHAPHFLNPGNNPTPERSKGRKPSARAGESGDSRQPPPEGSRNRGSAKTEWRS